MECADGDVEGSEELHQMEEPIKPVWYRDSSPLTSNQTNLPLFFAQQGTSPTQHRFQQEGSSCTLSSVLVGTKWKWVQVHVRSRIY